MFAGIDLSSDTATLPTAEMKRAMFEAELGDEQKGEDPTTRKLEERIAGILGKERALFFPSATMANEVALLLHCQRGDEVIAAQNAHIFVAESGAPAVWAGALARMIETPTGIFSGDDIRARFNSSKGPLVPVSRLVVAENTTNMGGGIAWRLNQLQSIWSTCRELGMRCHLDGARFFNAVTVTGDEPEKIASGFDTVTICLSKGLGCAAGALLAFESQHFDRVRRWKQCMGGSLRQSGILAAAGLYALDHHIERLNEDHNNARRLAAGLSGLKGIEVEIAEPDSNMVFFRLSGRSPSTFAQMCLDKGFRFSLVGENRFRAVTHLGVSARDIDAVIEKMRAING